MAGVGLFTARPATLKLRPRKDGNGLFLRRSDPGLPEPMQVPFEAHVRNVQQVPGLPGRNTVLGPAPGGPLVITTEHLLSALAGLGVTDIDIELSGPEIPLLDGSASDFCSLIREQGLEDLPSGIEPLKIAEAVRVEGPGGASIVAVPRNVAGCSYTYNLDYTGVAGAERFTPQTARWDGTPGTYRTDIAAARTFCLIPEAMAMRQAGLFLHLTPKDMLVLDPSGKPVETVARFEDEPARHKLLDLIGDLALVGRPIQADITATKAGHAMNQAMARKLLDSAPA